MSAEKISELEKNQALQDAMLGRILQAVEKQAISTEKLTESVTKLTANLSATTSETKELRAELRAMGLTVQELSTEMAVMKRGTRWMEWMEKGITAAIVGAVVWAIKGM